MSLLRHLVFLYAIGISCLVLLAFGLVHLAGGYAHPAWSLTLIPWTFGVIGVLGLLGAWLTRRQVWAPLLVLMLKLGIGAALVCAAIAIWWAAAVDFPQLLLLAALLIFPAIPLGLAGAEIRRSQIHLSETRPSGSMKRWGIMLGIAAPLAVVGFRLGVQEWIYQVYAKDLGARALSAAQVVANGREFCVIGGEGETDLLELDDERNLRRALRRPMSGNDAYFGRPPHFGIRVDDEIYWWSFRQQSFFPEPANWTGMYRTTCNARPTRPFL